MAWLWLVVTKAVMPGHFVWIAFTGSPFCSINQQGKILNRVHQLIGVLGVGLLTACGGTSNADMEKYSEACVDFYTARRGQRGDEVEMRKHWMKEGKVVIALKVEKRGERGYTEELCVVDPEEGTVALPSMFDRARWSQ